MPTMQRGVTSKKQAVNAAELAKLVRELAPETEDPGMSGNLELKLDPARTPIDDHVSGLPPAIELSATGYQREPTGNEERWLLDRVGRPNLFLGMTTRDIRIARLRDRIVELHWTDMRAGYRDGQPETFRMLLERLYGQQIFKPQPSGEI
jgi:hypothetical protein